MTHDRINVSIRKVEALFEASDGENKAINSLTGINTEAAFRLAIWEDRPLNRKTLSNAFGAFRSPAACIALASILTVSGGTEAVAAAAAGLGPHPQDPRLLLDRALGNEHLGNYAAALADFDRIGAVQPDARTFEFAAQMALRLL